MIYVTSEGNYEVFPDRAALEQAALKKPDDYSSVVVVEGDRVPFAVETQPRVAWGDSSASTTAKVERKPRGPKWTPNDLVIRDILEFLAPGVGATARQISEECAIDFDVCTRHLQYLRDDGRVTLTGKTYRAVPGADKVAT